MLLKSYFVSYEDIGCGLLRYALRSVAARAAIQISSVLINGSAQRNMEIFTLNQIIDVTHNLSSLYYWVIYLPSVLLISDTEVKDC